MVKNPPNLNIMCSFKAPHVTIMTVNITPDVKMSFIGKYMQI